LFRHTPQQAARRALSLPEEPRYILFAARRENPIKRFELAREAVAHLNPELGAELLVAEGVPPDQMPLYINAADIVLLTSSREGSPNIVKEALACNQRVVSVDVGDVRERLAGIGGCVVCDDDQPATIAAAIETALSAPAPTNGREAVEQLSGEQLVRQIAQIYDLALRRSKNALHPQKQRGLKSEF
jgi:glycosyltransferase involved in cell wall biosynthesis